MNKTTIINLHTGSEYDVYIGRGSAFGNLYIIGVDGNREECVEKYKSWFKEKLRSTRFKTAVLKLKGKRLGCYCSPKSCHGDVIIEWLEEQSSRKKG